MPVLVERVSACQGPAGVNTKREENCRPQPGRRAGHGSDQRCARVRARPGRGRRGRSRRRDRVRLPHGAGRPVGDDVGGTDHARPDNRASDCAATSTCANPSPHQATPTAPDQCTPAGAPVTAVAPHGQTGPPKSDTCPVGRAPQSLVRAAVPAALRGLLKGHTASHGVTRPRSRNPAADRRALSEGAGAGKANV